ncbi:MAG: Zn-ribbon containing protein, partial [Candidatus Nanoarchaeia archaeon]
MPHQCVRCNTFYDNGSSEILKGCKCGSRLFFFIRKEALEKAKKVTEDLTVKEKKQIE